MKWHYMNWMEKVTELLVYATAVILANITLIFWYSVSNAIKTLMQGTDRYIIDLISYFILLVLFLILILATFSVIRKIK